MKAGGAFLGSKWSGKSSSRLSCLLHPSRLRWGGAGGAGDPGRVLAGGTEEQSSDCGSLKESPGPFSLGPEPPPRPALPFPHAPARR